MTGRRGTNPGDPGNGSDPQAAEWRAKLPVTSQPTTQPGSGGAWGWRPLMKRKTTFDICTRKGRIEAF